MAASIPTSFGYTGAYRYTEHPAGSTRLWHPPDLCRGLDEQPSSHSNSPHSLPVLSKPVSALTVHLGRFRGTVYMSQSSVARSLIMYFLVFNTRLRNIIWSWGSQTCILMHLFLNVRFSNHEFQYLQSVISYRPSKCTMGSGLSLFVIYVLHGFEWNTQGECESPHCAFSRQPKTNKGVTQFSSVVNKSHLFILSWALRAYN